MTVYQNILHRRQVEDVLIDESFMTVYQKADCGAVIL